MTIDIDSSVCQTYGVAKQGARFGRTKVRGYEPLLATVASTGEVAHSHMRGGNAGSARGAAALWPRPSAGCATPARPAR